MGMSQVAEANRPLLFLNPQGQFRDSGGGGTRLLHLSRDSQLSRALASGHSPTRIAFASRRGASSSPLVFLVLLRCVALLIAGQLSCLIAATISYTYTNSSVSLVFPSVFRLRRSHLSSLRSLSTLLRSSPWQRHRLDILVLNAAHLPEQPAQLPGCSDAGLSVVRPSIANGSEPCDALTGSCLRLASCSARVFLNGTHRRRRLPCARITGSGDG